MNKNKQLEILKNGGAYYNKSEFLWHYPIFFANTDYATSNAYFSEMIGNDGYEIIDKYFESINCTDCNGRWDWLDDNNKFPMEILDKIAKSVENEFNVSAKEVVEKMGVQSGDTLEVYEFDSAKVNNWKIYNPRNKKEMYFDYHHCIGADDGHNDFVCAWSVMFHEIPNLKVAIPSFYINKDEMIDSLKWITNNDW